MNIILTLFDQQKTYRHVSTDELLPVISGFLAESCDEVEIYSQEHHQLVVFDRSAQGASVVFCAQDGEKEPRVNYNERASQVKSLEFQQSYKTEQYENIEMFRIPKTAEADVIALFIIDKLNLKNDSKVLLWKK